MYYTVFPFLITFIIVISLENINFIPLVYIINFLVLFISLLISFKNSIDYIYGISINIIFHVIVFRGIITAIIAMANSTSIYQIVNTHEASYLFSICITTIVLFISFVLFVKYYNISKIQLLISHNKQLTHVSKILTYLVIFLLYSTFVYFFNIHLIWFNIFFILTRLFCMAFFYIILNNAIKTALFIEEEINLLNVQQQLKDQLKKQKTQKQLLDISKKYQHDTKKLLSNIQALIINKEYDKALDFIGQMDKEINYKIKNETEYSNNTMINLILNEMAEKCKKSNILFSSNCFIPEKFPLTLLQKSRLFNNLCSNAYEACLKQPTSEKRWIDCVSFMEDKKTFVIIFKNSYDGISIKNNNR